jgi:hypothetical protein
MKTTHKERRSDLSWWLLLFAFGLVAWHYTQSFINHQKAQFIQEVKVDGQGKN